MRRALNFEPFGSKRMLAEHPTNRRAGLFRQADWIVVVFLAVIYLATLTSDYYWDGITFALQIEKVAKGERGAALLFHQNHLIYNGFGYVLYRITQALGFSIRALQVLQIANAIAGAIAVGVFYRVAFNVTRSRVAAILSAAALAFSAVWWKLATDANAHIISILLILVCARALMAKTPSWILAAGQRDALPPTGVVVLPDGAGRDSRQSSNPEEESVCAEAECSGVGSDPMRLLFLRQSVA